MKVWQLDEDGRSGIEIRVRVPEPEIDYICRLTEGHDGLAIVRTEEGTRDILQFWTSTLQLPDLEDFLTAIAREIPCERLSGPTVMAKSDDYYRPLA